MCVTMPEKLNKALLSAEPALDRIISSCMRQYISFSRNSSFSHGLIRQQRNPRSDTVKRELGFEYSSLRRQVLASNWGRCHSLCFYLASSLADPINVLVRHRYRWPWVLFPAGVSVYLHIVENTRLAIE